MFNCLFSTSYVVAFYREPCPCYTYIASRRHQPSLSKSRYYFASFTLEEFLFRLSFRASDGRTSQIWSTFSLTYWHLLSLPPNFVLVYLWYLTGSVSDRDVEELVCFSYFLAINKKRWVHGIIYEQLSMSLFIFLSGNHKPYCFIYKYPKSINNFFIFKRKCDQQLKWK